MSTSEPCGGTRATYRVEWSAEDAAFVATCAKYPSLSWLAESADDAATGLSALVAEIEWDAMTPSSRRTWRLHDELSKSLTRESLDEWLPLILANFDRVESTVRGQPHLRNLDCWRRLVDERDVSAIREVMTGRDVASVEMREVSPFAGLLSQEARHRARQDGGPGGGFTRGSGQ